MKDFFPKCYACGGRATSKEHVPPKCIFPELKEAGVDYRKNLISVPSCDKHNTQKSADDEYLLFVLLMHFGNNQPGKEHFFKKLMRAVDRAPQHFKNFVYRHFAVTGENFKGEALQIDRDRFDRGMKLVAKALYYNVTKLQLTQPISVVSPVFFNEHPGRVVVHEPSFQAAEVAKRFIGLSEPFRGENADIFKYRYRNELDEQVFAVEMIYYEKFAVYGYSAPGQQGLS